MAKYQPTLVVIACRHAASVGATDVVWLMSLRAPVFSTEVVNRSGKLAKITAHRRAQRSIFEVWCDRSRGYLREAETSDGEMVHFLRRTCTPPHESDLRFYSRLGCPRRANFVL